MPPHRVYCEPYAGGLSILLNKKPAAREVAGDIDARLINCWRHLQGSPLLLEMVADTEYADSAFQDAARLVPAEMDGCTAAWAFLIRNRFSRGGLGRDFAWSDRLRGGQPGDVNAWDTIRVELPTIVERIRAVEFHCCDALRLIRLNDADDALIYCDPPYLHETRTVRKAYTHEMTAKQHAELLKTLCGCRGTVLLSGYRSALYDQALEGWTRHEFDMPNHSGQGKAKQRRVECLWIKLKRKPSALDDDLPIFRLGGSADVP